jgi:glutaredoxin
MAQIKVYGTRWCGDTRRALRIFDERKVPYQWIDIDQDKQGEKIVKDINNGNRSVPTIVFPDESVLVEPRNETLIKKFDSLGL